MRRTYLFAAILFVAAMLLSTQSLTERSARAQMQTDGHYQYAVKFVCGRSAPGTTQSQVVATGTYFTAINVHNPFAATAKFSKKFVVALPNETPGMISHFFEAALKSDEAFEIDCNEILAKTPMHSPFRKGFVVIESQTELDVVAVYTAAGSTGQVETMGLERVPARRIP